MGGVHLMDQLKSAYQLDRGWKFRFRLLFVSRKLAFPYSQRHNEIFSIIQIQISQTTNQYSMDDEIDKLFAGA